MAFLMVEMTVIRVILFLCARNILKTLQRLFWFMQKEKPRIAELIMIFNIRPCIYIWKSNKYIHNHLKFGLKSTRMDLCDHLGMEVLNVMCALRNVVHYYIMVKNKPNEVSECERMYLQTKGSNSTC